MMSIMPHWASAMEACINHLQRVQNVMRLVSFFISKIPKPSDWIARMAIALALAYPCNLLQAHCNRRGRMQLEATEVSHSLVEPHLGKGHGPVEAITVWNIPWGIRTPAHSSFLPISLSPPHHDLPEASPACPQSDTFMTVVPSSGEYL